MAESNRSVKKRKDGSKVITRTNKAGTTIKKVMGAKGEDGKRATTSTTRTKTKENGSTVKKRFGAKGGKTVTRSSEGKSTTRKTNAKGKVTGITKTRTTKGGETKTTTAKKGSARVKTANKIKNATTESKGRAGRIARLKAKKKAGTGGANVQKKINAARKTMRKNTRKRMNAKSES